MGGLFSSPSPPPMPEPEPVDPDNGEEERRLAMIERKRRGRRGTITTSPGGLLDLKPTNNQGHRLLGD